MPAPRPSPTRKPAPRRVRQRTGIFLLAAFLLGALLPLRSARAEGESEWNEQRGPREHELEESSAPPATHARFARRHDGARVSHAAWPSSPRACAPHCWAPPIRRQLRLPHRIPPPDEDAASR
jgi:hypothetical protein